MHSDIQNNEYLHRRKLLLGSNARASTFQYLKARLLLSPSAFQKCLHVVHTGVTCVHIRIAVPSKYGICQTHQSQCNLTLHCMLWWIWQCVSENFTIWCHQTWFLMPKLRKNSTSVGASHQTPLGELTALPQTRTVWVLSCSFCIYLYLQFYKDFYPLFVLILQRIIFGTKCFHLSELWICENFNLKCFQHSD